MRRPDARLQQGMTLIEVLVALAIVALTLATGFKAAGGVVVNAQRLSDLTVAQWCADNQLQSITLVRAWPGVGTSEFRCTQLGRELPGTLLVKPTPNANFRRVDAQVLDEQGRSILTLSTVISRY